MPEYVGHIQSIGKNLSNHWIDTSEPIVRCMDCKFSEELCDGSLECIGYLTEPWDYLRDKPNHKKVYPCGFCSWGEKRSDDSN